MGCCGRKDFVSGSSSFDHCLCEVVRVIKDIQDTGADECTDCPTSCFLTPLGGVSPGRTSPINTRVIVLLTEKGCPFKVQADPCDCSAGATEYCYFRIEEILDGSCCVTLRALTKSGSNFTKTDVCVTVDISCFCGIQCIADTFVEGVCD